MMRTGLSGLKNPLLLLLRTNQREENTPDNKVFGPGASTRAKNYYLLRLAVDLNYTILNYELVHQT